MTYGAAPYSAAPYSASNATPAPDAGAGVGLVALGFRTLTLGTPAVPQAAAGFSGTGFGAPSGLSAFRAGSIVPQTALGAAAATVSTPKVASGFEAVAFGQPSTALGAIGFQSGQPGVASASVRFRAAALAPGTQIPTPYTPQVATGFSAAVLGQPFVLKYLPPVLD
ncbi:MAG: hypothetical protein JWQ88_3202, partial [Rhodoferax sp.]|nr:hypothetical protein [Rhodoferax sp.]